jgi:hypothetical protein
MSQNVFIIILIIVLILMLFEEKCENFNNDLNTTQSDKTVENTGIFNYFYWFFMNPYPLPMNKFFSNDKVGTVNDR